MGPVSGCNHHVPLLCTHVSTYSFTRPFFKAPHLASFKVFLHTPELLEFRQSLTSRCSSPFRIASEAMEVPRINAASQAFETFELAELILSHLNLLEVLRTERTRRGISSVIRSSPTLKRRLYFLQPRNEDLHRCTDYYGAPVRPRDPPHDAFVPHVTFDGPFMTPFLDTTLLNPLLPLIFPGHRVTPLENGWILLILRNLPNIPRDVQPSWASMLFTAQPLKQLHIEAATMLHDTSTPSMSYHLPPPDPAEAERIAALHARISMSRARTAGVDKPADFPIHAIRRLAAARGEASRDGWIWGSSLEFVKGRKPRVLYEPIVTNEGGVRIGQLEALVRKTGWNIWVLRKLE